MYLSLESMLCFFWLFLFLFYTQCMYYLCFFWGVYIGLKFVIKKMLLKDILSCLWFIIYKCLLRPTWVCHVCADEKKEEHLFIVGLDMVVYELSFLIFLFMRRT